jgi:hypothetical protein
VDGVEPEALGLISPGAADGFVWGEATKGLEALGEVVGVEEGGEMLLELPVCVVVIPSNGALLEGSVHALDLTVRPRVVRLGQAVFDPVRPAGPIEGVTSPASGWAFAVLGQVGELDAVVGQHGVNLVRHGLDEFVEELSCRDGRRLRFEPCEHVLRRAIHGDEQVELAFLGADLGNVDVEEADRVALESLPGGLVALDPGQPADAMALVATVQG